MRGTNTIFSILVVQLLDQILLVACIRWEHTHNKYCLIFLCTFISDTGNVQEIDLHTTKIMLKT